MAVLSTSSGWTLSALLDYFIPKAMIADAEQHRRARMFMLSHAFGPILGSSLPIYLAAMDIVRDYRVVVFLLSILAFWIYPFVLRWTGRYKLLSFISVQNLIFCVSWACYAFGGLTSPFLSWVLIFPLLAFLYLPPVGWVRNVLLLQIFGSVAVLILASSGLFHLPEVNLAHMQIIGMMSMASVAIYFAMMSLYFAKMFNEQREFSRELNSLVSTSDNMRNLTSAAQQAGAAKADFIASMSHELRTPLNAIIGYSQLLLEEAEEEEDEESISDLSQVHKSGSDLLYLIDHILDYSRIDAGKMPINPTFAKFPDKFDQWKAEAARKHADFTIELVSDDAPGEPVCTDWTALSAIVRSIATGLAMENEQGRIDFALQRHGDDFLLSFVHYDHEGKALPVSLETELFDDEEDDVSPTKYGSMGIELALAFKYIELLGGTVEKVTSPDGLPVTRITLTSAVDSYELPEAA